VEEPRPITEVLRPIGERGEREPEFPTAVGNRCRVAFFDKRDASKPLPYWRVIKRGVHYGVRVLFTSPQPCTLTPTTRIVYSESCEYSLREVEHNVVITEDCGTGRKHVYAYPKNVWRELHDYYIKPLVANEDPYNVGVILMGPPGTGKSRLAKIIAKYVGVNTTKIDTTILSKWVGESERQLKKLIEEARSSQPSIIILDDAEWLLSSRALAGGHDDALSQTRANMQQLLFDAMQEIYDLRERVLFIATTNVKQEVLDPALIRHGRFGPPIFVPLPDLEAAKIIVREVLPDKPEEEVERIAFIAVNAGLSVADTIALADRVRRGGEPKPRTVGGRGYTRIFVEQVDEFSRIERDYHVPMCDMLSTKSRLMILGNEDVGVAFAAQLAYSCRKTVIKLVDPRQLDEAIHSANMLGSAFIAPTRLHQDYLFYAHDNADVPIFFVGERPPPVEAFYLGDVPYMIARVGVRAAVRAVAALKGLSISDELLKKIERKVAGDYKLAETVLRMIVSSGVADEKYFENMLAWIRK